VNPDTRKVTKSVNVIGVKAIFRFHATSRITMCPGEDMDVIPALLGVVHDADEVMLIYIIV
jgi:hypothetical protein